jgi:hypothetical protein
LSLSLLLAGSGLRRVGVLFRMGNYAPFDEYHHFDFKDGRGIYARPPLDLGRYFASMLNCSPSYQLIKLIISVKTGLFALQKSYPPNLNERKRRALASTGHV